MIFDTRVITYLGEVGAISIQSIVVWTELYRRAEFCQSARSAYLRFESSDHRPLITTFDTTFTKRRGLFRYDRRLRNNTEVKKIIAQEWSSNKTTSVEQRISNARQAISRWNKENHKIVKILWKKGNNNQTWRCLNPQQMRSSQAR